MVQPTSAAQAAHITPMCPLPPGAAMDPYGSLTGSLIGRDVVTLPIARAEALRRPLEAVARGIDGVDDLSSLADRVTQSSQGLGDYVSLNTFPGLSSQLMTTPNHWHSEIALRWDIAEIKDLGAKLCHPSATLESRVSLLALLERAFVDIATKAHGTAYLSFEQAAKLEEIRGGIFGAVDAMKRDGRLPPEAVINIPEFFCNLDVREFFRSYVVPANRQLFAYGASVPLAQIEEIIANTATLPEPLRDSIAALVAAIPEGDLDRAAKVLKAIDSALKDMPQYTPGPVDIVQYAIREKARESQFAQLEFAARNRSRSLMTDYAKDLTLISYSNDFSPQEMESLKGAVARALGPCPPAQPEPMEVMGGSMESFSLAPLEGPGVGAHNLLANLGGIAIPNQHYPNQHYGSAAQQERFKDMVWRLRGKPVEDPIFRAQNLVANLAMTAQAIHCAGVLELRNLDEEEIDALIESRRPFLNIPANYTPETLSMLIGVSRANLYRMLLDSSPFSLSRC